MMTDREKLVELLDYIRYSQEFSCYDFYDMSDAAESIADFLISKGVTVQEWISAKEPPKEWKDAYGTLINYLVYMPEYGVDVGNYMQPANTWLCMGLPGKVTHWMPMPKPPKE